jgi:hypothetical protein
MSAPPSPRLWTRGRVLGVTLALSILGLFIAANTHLVALAYSSQPDCVPHLKSPKEGAATFRAAKPSC